MNNKQRKALAAFLSEDGWAVTKAEVDAIIEQIRADVAEGTLKEMPESVTDLPDSDAYLSEAANAVYSRTGENRITRIYQEGLTDALDLALQERLRFVLDEAYWEDTEETNNG